MARRRTQPEIIKAIRIVLSKKSASINEIADDIDAKWETVEKALTLLKEMDFVSEMGEGNAREFTLKRRPSDLKKGQGTLFRIPLSPKEQLYSDFLIYEVIHQWKAVNGSVPNHTQIQKAAVAVADQLQLPVPRAWYLYGKLLLRCCNPEEPPTLTEVPAEAVEIRRVVKKFVEQLGNLLNTDQLMKEQYLREESRLYEVKRRLMWIGANDLNAYETRQKTISLLYELLIEIPRHLDKGVIREIAQGFVSAAVQLLLHAEDVNKYSNELADAFRAVWDFLAVEIFVDTLVGYSNYDREAILPYVEEDLIIKEQVATYFVGLLWDYCRKDTPALQKPLPDLLKLKGSVKGARKLSMEDRRRLSEWMKDSDIFREAGLD